MIEEFEPLPMKSLPSRLNPVDNYLAGSWEALGAGAPTLVALAQICSQALVDQPDVTLDSLSVEAQAILFAAQSRGTMEVRPVQSAFEAPSRLLAVYVELDDEQTVAFRCRLEPEVTMKFFDGFLQLCRKGFVVHHIHRDFCLSRKGYELARSILQEDVQSCLDRASDSGLHD